MNGEFVMIVGDVAGENDPFLVVAGKVRRDNCPHTALDRIRVTLRRVAQRFFVWVCTDCWAVREVEDAA